MAIAAVGLTTHILNNQLKSVLLLMGFPLLLALMMGGFFAGLDMLAQPQGMHDVGRAGNAAIAGMIRYGHWAAGAAAIWFTIAFFFHGQMMRRATGSVPVTRDQMPRIYNLLENLCISRGITMPQFEIIDSPALNAFATGINDKTYKIVLTRGLIDRLSEDELEGVIAHELTHIVNRDVRLLIISVIFVGIISFMAELAFRALVRGGGHYMPRGRKQGGGAVLVVLLALVILVIGYILALVIRFAISRKREFLADAGAVELTKNPEAMMRALQRISGQDRVQGMPDEVQQMCIENSQAFMGIFATHPPIPARIEALSLMTGTPIPIPQVSLKRGPRGPWEDGIPKESA